MSRFETPQSAMRRAQQLMQRQFQREEEQHRLSVINARRRIRINPNARLNTSQIDDRRNLTDAQKRAYGWVQFEDGSWGPENPGPQDYIRFGGSNRPRSRKPQSVSLAEQNRLRRDLFARSSPQEVQRLQALTTDELLQEAQGGRRQAPSDIGSPTGEAVFPGVVGKIPGLRTPAEAASTIGTAGMGSLPMAARAGGLALGLGGAFGGGEVAERTGVPRPIGEAIGGLGGGLAGGVAGPMAARRIGTNLDIATQRAGGARALAGSEAGGTRIPRGGRQPAARRTADSPAARLNQAIKATGKARPEQVRMFAEQRAQRTGEAAGALEAGIARGEPAAGFAESKRALAGEFERPQFGTPDFQPDDMRGFLWRIGISNTEYYTKMHAQEALEEIARGRIPQPAMLADLERAVPEAKDLVRTVLSKRSLGTKAWEEIVSGLGLPQALKSTLDFGSRMRQGIVLGWSNPKQWLSNWKPTVNAMFSEEAATSVQRQLEQNPWYSIQSGERAGLGFVDGPRPGHIYRWDPTTRGPDRVEGFEGMNPSFISRATQHIPGLRGSQRSFATDLNKSGVEVYAKRAEAMWKSGVRDPGQYQSLREGTNHARGFGSFRPGEIVKGVNAFFSPRNFVSRFEVIIDPLRHPGSLFSPSARRYAAENLVGMVMGDLSVLGLIGTAGAATGLASVEVNPLKPGADWLKVKVGNTRFDPWGGFQPIARLIVKMAAAGVGEAGVADTGVTARDAKRQLVTFFTNKEAPLVRLVTDALEISHPFDEKPTAERLAELFTPFIVDDVREAVREHGLLGIAVAPVSTVGIGVQTYGPPEEEPEKPKPVKRGQQPQIAPPGPRIAPRRRLEGTIGSR